MDKAKPINIAYVIALYLAVALVIFWFCRSLEWSEDDLFYQFNYATGRLIGSVGDILQSQIAHWQGHNGRFVVHCLVQLFVSFGGHAVFATANAVVMVLLVMEIIRLAGGKVWSAKEATLAVLSCLLFCDTHYSPPCQINYIWTGLFNLLFLQNFFGKRDYVREHKWLLPVALLLSALVGNCNEAINVGIIGALGILALQRLRKLTVTQYTLLMGYLIGVAILCIAPSNLRRADSQTVSLFYSIHFLLTHLRITYILIAYISYAAIVHHITLKEIYHNNSVYINAILITLGFNLLVGIINNRQIYGIELLSCVIFLKLAYRYGINRWLLLIGVIGIGIIYLSKWHCIQAFNQAYRDFAAQISAGATVVYVDTPAQWRYIDPASPFTHVSKWHIFIAQAHNKGKLDMSDDIDAVVYPTCMRTIESQPVANTVHKLDNGTYLLLQDKSNPRQFTLERNINILGIKIPYSPYPITFNPNARQNTEAYNVIISDFYSPMTDVTGVSVSE